MLLSGISIENTYDNREKIIQYAPLECLPLISPFQLQARLFLRGISFPDFGIAPKAMNHYKLSRIASDIPPRTFG